MAEDLTPENIPPRLTDLPVQIMKKALCTFVLAASAICATAAPLVVNEGDLMMGFFKIDTEGTGVETSSVIVNLGPVATWRENTNRTVLIGNVAPLLEEAFGADWARSNKVRTGIVATVPNTDVNNNAITAISGDPARTVYLSKAMATFSKTPAVSPQNSAFTLSTTNMGTVSNGIKFLRSSTSAAAYEASASNPNAAVVSPANASGAFASQVPPSVGTYFGGPVDPLASLGAQREPGALPGIGTGTGDYTVEAGLELYRLIFSTNNADLTVGLQPGNAAVRTSQFVGSFTLDSAGNIRFDTPAVSAPAGYSAWADTKGLAGAARDTGADPDGDGVPNGVEFVTGSEPLVSDNTKAPVLNASAGSASFVYRRADAAVTAGAQITVEYDEDLLGTWTAAPAGTVENDAVAAGIDRVTVTIPAGPGRVFVRLRVTNL